MPEKLKNNVDERNFDLFRIVFNLKRGLDVHRLIAVNADAINSAGAGKSFFAYTQTLAIESCVVNICKLVEKEKRSYSLNSIPGIIKFLRDEDMQPRNTDQINIYLQKNGEECVKGKEITALEKIFDKFNTEHETEVERLKTLRDKRIAHAEDILVERKTAISSYAIMERFLRFGYEFYAMIQETYVESGPIILEANNKVANGLVSLLELKGIKDIKRDFND
jgi:hypothetical protein